MGLYEIDYDILFGLFARDIVSRDIKVTEVLPVIAHLYNGVKNVIFECDSLHDILFGLFVRDIVSRDIKVTEVLPVIAHLYNGVKNVIFECNSLRCVLMPLLLRMDLVPSAFLIVFWS